MNQLVVPAVLCLCTYSNWFVLPVYWHNWMIFRTHPCLDFSQFLPNYVISTVISIVLVPALLCSSPFLLCKVVRPLFIAICITDRKSEGSKIKTKLYRTEDGTYQVTVFWVLIVCHCSADLQDEIPTAEMNFLNGKKNLEYCIISNSSVCSWDIQK